MFPFNEEKEFKRLLDRSTEEFEEAIKELKGKREITKEDAQRFQAIISDHADNLALKLVDTALMFQKQIFDRWVNELGPIERTEIINSKSWVQENIKTYKQTPKRSFKQLDVIRRKRKEEYLKDIQKSFDIRLNKKKLSKKDETYIKNVLKAQGYDRYIPKLDKFTGEDLKILKDWIRKRNLYWARDKSGDIYAQEIKELSLINNIKAFIWETEKDLRVRIAHKVRQGKKFFFDKIDYLPGSQILCRCWARPIRIRKSRQKK